MKFFFRSAALFATLLFSVAAGAERSRSVIPLTVTEDEYFGGRIYLQVRIDNVMGPMRLDTGASSTRLRLAPWNKDLPVLGESVSTGASGATMHCDEVEAPKVELVASEGNNVARTNYDITRCPTDDGDDLLGIDFFRGARFSLDIDRRELVFFGEATAGGQPTRFGGLGPTGVSSASTCISARRVRSACSIRARKSRRSISSSSASTKGFSRP